MDRGDSTLGVVNVELIISPAKRTKLSKSQNTRKRVFAKKQPLRREIGKQSSTLVSEKLETEFLLERDKKTEMLDKEDLYETVRCENSFNKTSKKNACLEKITLSEEKLFTESNARFMEPAHECLIESGFALESVGADLDTLQNKSKSTSIEDAIFSHETTSCSRGFDLDQENDLDPNCLKLLVIGNENLDETSLSDSHVGAVSNFKLTDDLGFKYLGSIRESKSKYGFSLDLKNIDADLELKCEVIESNNDLRSPDDLDLDLKCDVSLNGGSLQPTASHDIESKSAAVRSIQSSDVDETDFTSERDLDAVSSDLHSALNIDSVHSCSRRPKKVSFSCRSFISRFLPNRLQKTGDYGRAFRVTKGCEASIISQGHIVESEGHITKSQSHICSKGCYRESQCHHFEFHDHCIKCQGHRIKSQGHCVESQGQVKVLNSAQVTGVNLMVCAARPGDGDICDSAAESKAKDFVCYGSPFEVVTLQEVSSTSEEVSSTQSSTRSGTLEEESSTSKEEDLSSSQCSDNYELHINIEDDLTVVACAGSLLKASSVLT